MAKKRNKKYNPPKDSNESFNNQQNGQLMQITLDNLYNLQVTLQAMTSLLEEKDILKAQDINFRIAQLEDSIEGLVDVESVMPGDVIRITHTLHGNDVFKKFQLSSDESDDPKDLTNALRDYKVGDKYELDDGSFFIINKISRFVPKEAGNE